MGNNSLRWSEATAQLRREMAGLERRLYELRMQLAGAEPLSGVLEWVECRAGGDLLALPLPQVEQVVPIARLTPIPEAPAWMLGLLNLHGSTIPVIDVAVRLRKSSREVDLTDLVVICSARGTRVGLLVQAVVGTRRIDAGIVERPAEDVPHAPYLVGTVTVENNLLFLVNLDALVVFSSFQVEGSPGGAGDR